MTHYSQLIVMRCSVWQVRKRVCGDRIPGPQELQVACLPRGGGGGGEGGGGGGGGVHCGKLVIEFITLCHWSI